MSLATHSHVIHLLLIRHGQTDANAAGIVQGHLPTELNETGRKQSLLLARHLQNFSPRITRLLSSPLVRAKQTAEPFAHALGLPLLLDDRWTERHFGSAQGKPADLRRIITHGQPTLVLPDDAEPRDTFDTRVRDAVESCSAPTNPHPSVTAIVTHGGVIGSVMRQILSGAIPTTNPPTERPEVPNCSILHFSRPAPDSGTGPLPWTIQCLCDISHLAGLRTALDAG